MSEITKTNRGLPLIIASCFYIAVGVYLLIFSLERAIELWTLVILNVASIIAGIGIYLLKRWSFWLAIVVSPLLITVAASTLAFSTGIPAADTVMQGILFEASLTIIIVLTVISFLIVLVNNDKLRKGSFKSSDSKSD
ncbi:hypothetical protein [[Eubacterium] cellulosolvens]